MNDGDRPRTISCHRKSHGTAVQAIRTSSTKGDVISSVYHCQSNSDPTGIFRPTIKHRTCPEPVSCREAVVDRSSKKHLHLLPLPPFTIKSTNGMPHSPGIILMLMSSISILSKSKGVLLEELRERSRLFKFVKNLKIFDFSQLFDFFFFWKNFSSCYRER